MHLNAFVKAALSAAMTALLMQAAGSASAAAPEPSVENTVTVAADSYDAVCRSHSRDYILKRYY